MADLQHKLEQLKNNKIALDAFWTWLHLATTLAVSGKGQ